MKDDSIVIEDYCGEELDVSIPAEIEGLPVKKIAPEAFSITWCNDRDASKYRERVTEIGDGAFKMCMSLEELVLQEGVCRIGESVLLVTAVTAVVSADHSGKTEMPMGMGKSSDWMWHRRIRIIFQMDMAYMRKHPEDGYALVAVRAEDQRVRYTVASQQQR